MTGSNSTRNGSLRAVAYVRYSTDQQDGSDEQQAAEIDKLAERAGCQIVATYTDQGISGDSGRELRPELGRMLDAAADGRFEVLLAWDTSRIGRQDCVAVGELLAVLKGQGIVIKTCRDGDFDLRNSQDRIRYMFLTEGNNSENVRRAYNTTRGLIRNAKAGNRNGARANFAMDRAQFTPDGTLVRRLVRGQRKDTGDHVVRLVRSEDKDKVAAVRFAFQRYGSVDIGLRALAAEMDGKGYPSPTGKGWNHKTLRSILSNPVYRGTSRWGARAAGKYHHAVGDDIIPAGANGHRKQPEDMILVEGSDGLVEPELFDKVQRRLTQRANHRATPRSDFPLSGLIFCEHCGRPMVGHTTRRRYNGTEYTYTTYVCQSYKDRGARSGCGHYQVDSRRLLVWLQQALQEAFLGPGRDILVEDIKRVLVARTAATGDDRGRLEKRLAALDSEVANLVKLARSVPDVAEVAHELAEVRRERERIKAELAQTDRTAAPSDVEAQARRIADEVWRLGEAFSKAKPGTLKGLVHEAVSRITCRFERGERQNGRTPCKLVKGRVLLRPSPMWAFLSPRGNNGGRRWPLTL
jgi:DNA invertase Pin-like site-specific DNA recombinase